MDLILLQKIIDEKEMDNSFNKKKEKKESGGYCVP